MRYIASIVEAETNAIAIPIRSKNLPSTTIPAIMVKTEITFPINTALLFSMLSNFEV